MEATCIKCGRAFESDSWNMDICPVCENELIELEKEMDDDMTLMEDESTSLFEDL
jgi:Zn finger protein HypA/HybF involved in hydrogenase expression